MVTGVNVDFIEQNLAMTNKLQRILSIKTLEHFNFSDNIQKNSLDSIMRGLKLKKEQMKEERELHAQVTQVEKEQN